MLKTLISAAAAAAALMVAPSAFAQDWYVRGELGSSVAGEVDANSDGKFDLENGLVVAGAVGADLGSGIRVEGELVYLDNDVKAPGGGADVKITALFANVAYDFETGAGFTPYVGAGIGWANTDHSNILTKDDDTNFAWQLKGGVGWEVSPGVILDANYRYLNAPDFEGNRIGGGSKVSADTDAHVLSLGLRYKFGM